MKARIYIFISAYILINLFFLEVCRSEIDNDLKKITKDTISLDEVVVGPQSMSTLSFRTTVFQTQKIGKAELSRAACCNLSESFETNPSVDVSYSNAITGAKQIRLLGLDGTYVQLLAENVPAYNGLARIYGLDYIPGPWMESILVSKGTSSIKNGYEAITGQINVEYKKPPTSDILSANVFAADNGRIEANADATALLSDRLSTGLFLHYSNEQKQMDANKDGFLDTPLKSQYNIFNRWYYRSENFISQLGIQYLHDKREGGQTDKVIIPESTSRYKTNLLVDRISFFTKNGLILDSEKNESFAIIVSGAYQDQNSNFGIKHYNADEKSLYASLLYEKGLNTNNKISTGVSMNYLNIKEYFMEIQSPNFIETTTGTYVEYTYNNQNNLILLAGLRADYSNLFDLFVTPRLHVKYNFTEWFHIRGTIGKGYRTPLIVAENQYFLASNREFIITPEKIQEEAWNYGVNLGFYIPINNQELIVNAEWYYTDFQKQLIVDLDSDPHSVLFYDLNGKKSYSSIFQIEAAYPFFKGFNITTAFRWMDVKATYKNILREKPLTSKYKALITASYQTNLRKWQFDLTSQFNGGGRMPQPDINVKNALWNNTFPAYTIINAQVTKNFRDWSIYSGVENLFDYTQKNRVIGYDNPFGDHFDATMIWGPLHGRKFYIGVRYNIQRL